MKKYNLTDAQLKGLANIAVNENDEPGVENVVSQMANRFEMQTKYKSIVDYVLKSKWYSRAQHWYTNGKSSASAVAKTRSVLVDGKRTLPTYVDEFDCTSDILWIKNNGVKADKNVRSNYKKDITRIRNRYDSEYTFFCFASPSKYADPMGYTDEAYKKKKDETAVASNTGTTVTASTNQIDKVLSIAEAEVGYLEKKSNSQLDSKTANAGNNNYTKYARDLFQSLQGMAWCAMFVAWCFYKTFGKETAKKMLGGLSADCDEVAEQYKSMGRWYKSPKVGDQILFIKNGNDYYHTGLVYKVDSSKVYTIEGNTSAGSAVIPNGGAVCKKSYSLSDSKIGGYGRPKYSSSSSSASSSSSKVSTPTKLTESVAWNGIVTASSLNVRSWAGAENSTVSFSPLPNGTKVGVCAEIKADDGSAWYYIKYNGKYGFVSAEYVKKS